MKKLLTTIVILCSITTFAQPKLSALEQEGTNFFKEGNNTNAIASFEKALVLSPNSLYSINALSKLYSELKEWQKDYNMAEKGMKLSGNAANFVYLRADAAYHLNKPQEVITIIDNYELKNKADYMLLFVKGNAYKQLGDKQQAIAAYSQSITADANFANTYFERGKLLQIYNAIRKL